MKMLARLIQVLRNLNEIIAFGKDVHKFLEDIHTEFDPDSAYGRRLTDLKMRSKVLKL